MNARARIPISFPNAPTVGQQFTASSGVTYEWDGTVWIDVVPPAPPYVETDPLALHRTGGVMTGNLELRPVNPQNAFDAVPKSYVDQLITGTTLLVGGIDAATGQCIYTTLSGFTNGPLVTAATAEVGHFVLCDNAGTIPNGVGPPETWGIAMELLDMLLSDGNQWFYLPSGNQIVTLASQVGLAPNVAGADNVQTGMENIQAQKVAKAGDAMTGGLSFGSVAQTTLNDVTRHLALWGTTFGFNITSGQLNAIVPQANTFTVRVGANQRMSVADGTVGINTGLTCQGTASFQSTSNFSNMITIQMGNNTTGLRLYKPNRDNNTAVPCIEFSNSKGGGGGNGVLTRIQCFQTNQWYAYQDYSRTSFYCGSGILRETFRGEAQHLYCPTGNMYANAFTVNSDASRKMDIVPASEDDAVEAFDKLKPMRFRWKPEMIDNPMAAPHGKSQLAHPDPERLNWGFLAQDVEVASPDLVHTHKELGKSYDLTGVVAVLTAKIQQLEARLAANGL